MKYIEGIDRGQLILYPERLDDLVGDENPVRVIDAFVEMLDLGELGFKKARLDPASAGAPCYAPGSLMKLYIYGYSNKIRSSRKLNGACGNDINAMWLMCGLRPDHWTISEFRRENAGAVKQVFKAFVRMCIEMGLYKTEVGVQDGSKFRANNSKDNNVTVGKLEKKIEISEEQISKYFAELDKSDEEESHEHTKEEIEEKLAYLRENIEKYNEYMKYMKDNGISQMSFVDPESRLMKFANGGFNVGYNVQTVTDPESHMVGYAEVTNECSDKGLVTPVMEAAKEDFGVEVIESVEDNGYDNRDDMLESLKSGTVPHVISKTAGGYEFEMEYAESEITEEEVNSTKSEDIQKCMSAGIVPKVYEGKGIDITVEEEEECGIEEGDEEAIFRLNEEKTAVTCPNGSVLRKVAELYGKGKTRYTSRSACRRCEEKCTTAAFRQVDLWPGQRVLQVKKRRKVKKVRIKFKPNKEKTANRKCVAEHPFGTVKHWRDGSYMLLRGKLKVGTEVALLFLGYNLTRAVNMAGVQGLIAQMALLYGSVTKFL